MQRAVQPFTIGLSDPSARDPELVGEAGSWLAILQQNNVPVIDGFIITSYVFHTAPHGEITPDVEAAIKRAWQTHSLEIATLRPSIHITKHHGSYYDNQLRVRHNIKPERMSIAIESIWQSSSNPKLSGVYTNARIAPEAASVAIIVQKQLESPEITWQNGSLSAETERAGIMEQLAKQAQQQIDKPVKITMQTLGDRSYITDIAYQPGSAD